MPEHDQWPTASPRRTQRRPRSHRIVSTKRSWWAADMNRGRASVRNAWTRLRLHTQHQRRSTDEPAMPEAEVAGLSSATAIVFSKDRAMQLDACLRSIEAFAPYSGRVLIIYRATTPAFEAGYRSIELSSTADLIEETSEFRQDVLAAVRSDTTGYVVFHTDDDIFFRRPRPVPAFS